MTQNPLIAWLQKKGLKPYQFALQAGLSKRTVYRYAHDEDRRFEVESLLKIEEGTGGEVTLRQLVNWISRPVEKAPDDAQIQT